jgi:hypothetical protein
MSFGLIIFIICIMYSISLWQKDSDNKHKETLNAIRLQNPAEQEKDRLEHIRINKNKIETEKYYDAIRENAIKAKTEDPIKFKQMLATGYRMSDKGWRFVGGATIK